MSGSNRTVLSIYLFNNPSDFLHDFPLSLYFQTVASEQQHAACLASLDTNDPSSGKESLLTCLPITVMG